MVWLLGMVRAPSEFTQTELHRGARTSLSDRL